jgi:hypothetical protein
VPYKHDIFISYKRDVETRHWINEHLMPLLTTYVGMELGRPPDLFIDDQLEAGTTWPLDLGVRLAGSRVLLALYTKTYFHSEWCTRELAAMLQRERDAGFRTAARPEGLIVPVILHDCEQLPSEIQDIQARPIREYFNVRMRRDSQRAELLADEIAKLAIPIARAIDSAPDWRPEWREQTAQFFQQAIRASGETRQLVVPRFAAP